MWLLLVLVIGPIVELWFIIQVASVIGGWQTIALLLVEGLIGSWLIKRQGRSVVTKIDQRLRDHQLPTTELADGFLLLTAGVLMLAPGFIGDIVGFALLFPPTRAVARALLLKRFTARMGKGFTFVSASGFGPAVGRSDIFDTTVSDPPARERARSDAPLLGPGERL